MKMLWGILLLFSWISGGCLTLPARWMEPKTPPVATAPAAATPERAPVTQDQVREENARELADALLEELDQEAQRPQTAEPKKP